MTEETCPSCHRQLPPDAPGGLCPVCVLLGAREDGLPAGLPSLDEIRAAFPQFEIIACIGHGGMGAVYKARQPQLDRLVALKILLPGLHHDPGFSERFSREARALAKLSHPCIVGVHDFGESGGFFWLTMEHVDGVNLRQAMQAARFTPEQALAIIPDLCAALQYAHDHGVLHRDIKPENILLDARGKVKVADFGIARMAGEEAPGLTLTITGSALGSAAYVAPEQIENPHGVDHRADLYSMGVVFYEMLTGELPLGRFPAPSERSSSDPRLDEVVFRTLEKEREKRYQSADEVRTGVENACNGPVKSGPAPRPNLLAWTVALVVGGGVLLGTAAVTGSAWFTGIGACVVLSGLSVGWRLLWRMKSGGMPLKGRRLLLALVVWPPVISLAGALVMMATGQSWRFFEGKGHLFLGLLLVSLAAFVSSSGFFRAAALPGDRHPRGPMRWIVAMTSLAVAVAALVFAKRLEGRAPAYHGHAVVQLRPKLDVLGSSPPSESVDLREARLRGYLSDAAGDHGPKFDIIRIPGTSLWSVGIVTPDQNDFEAQWEAYYRRLVNTLPPGSMEGEPIVHETAGLYQESDKYPQLFWIMVATTSAAVLAGWCLFPLAWFAAAPVWVAALALLVTPLWPSPAAGENLISGPPLPPVEKPVPSPENAICAMLKAAQVDDEPTFRHGMSRVLAEMLRKEGDNIAEPLRDFRRVSYSSARTLTDTTAEVVLTSNDGKSPPVTFKMILEDGEWKLTVEGH